MNLANRLGTLSIASLLVLGSASLFTIAFADPPDHAKNGWGEATSERATEKELGTVGEHASDPDGDGIRGNENQHTDDNDNNNRIGLGGVAELFTGQKNPDELGDLLDDIDCNIDDGESGPTDPSECD